MVRPATIKSSAVAECQAQGMTQRETAAKLGISLSGVQSHWNRSEAFGRPSHAAAVAVLVDEGKTDKEIAKELGISVSTANRQRRALAMKNAPSE